MEQFTFCLQAYFSSLSVILTASCVFLLLSVCVHERRQQCTADLQTGVTSLWLQGRDWPWRLQPLRYE